MWSNNATVERDDLKEHVAQNGQAKAEPSEQPWLKE